MNFCGFPQNGQLADTTLCPLYNSTAGTPIPSNQNDAVCSNNATMLGQSCPVNNNLNTAISNMNTQYTNEVTKDWSLVLSLLFNAFIMCQVKPYARCMSRSPTSKPSQGSIVVADTGTPRCGVAPSPPRCLPWKKLPACHSSHNRKIPYQQPHTTSRNTSTRTWSPP